MSKDLNLNEHVREKASVDLQNSLDLLGNFLPEIETKKMLVFGELHHTVVLVFLQNTHLALFVQIRNAWEIFRYRKKYISIPKSRK